MNAVHVLTAVAIKLRLLTVRLGFVRGEKRRMPVRKLMVDDIERRLGHTVYRLATGKVETAPRLERLHMDVGGGMSSVGDTYPQQMG